MAKSKPKVTFRANCIVVGEYDRRVARMLSFEGYRLRDEAEAVMRDGERWDRGSPLYREARTTYLLIGQAAILIEDMAKRIISKGLPKRERAMLAKILTAEEEA